MGYPYQNANYGDYYQGDIFGSIFKGIVGAGKGFISGGPLGAIKGGLGGALSKQGTTPKPPQVPAGYPGAVPAPGLGGLTARYLPGGSSGYQAGSCPPGYHKNKALAQYERAVAMGKQVKMPNVVNACVKHRGQNPMNVRALRRAVRREGAAIGLLREGIKGSGYSVKRSGLPKARKRR
jgi:hypothetical protein